MVKEPLSSLHANVEVSVAVKLKLAVLIVTVPVGPAVMEVSGGVLSTVTVLTADVPALFEGSKARTVILADPSAIEAEFQVRL